MSDQSQLTWTIGEDPYIPPVKEYPVPPMYGRVAIESVPALDQETTNPAYGIDWHELRPLEVTENPAVGGAAPIGTTWLSYSAQYTDVTAQQMSDRMRQVMADTNFTPPLRRDFAAEAEERLRQETGNTEAPQGLTYWTQSRTEPTWTTPPTPE